MAEANRALDDAVKSIHEQDRARAEILVDVFAEGPRRREMVRELVRVFEHIREDGAAHPELALEIAKRRHMAKHDNAQPTAFDLKAAMTRVNRVANG